MKIVAPAISVRARAVNYGLGCFGGVRGYLADDGKQVLVFRIPEHMTRLQHSAKVLYMVVMRAAERRYPKHGR